MACVIEGEWADWARKAGANAEDIIGAKAYPEKGIAVVVLPDGRKVQVAL